jgi:L-lysine exporter family protein LysE/ArgO
MGEVLQHVLLGLSVAVPPGPASVAIAEAGLRRGVGRALQTALGVAMADVTFLLVVYFGLSGLVGTRWVRVTLLLSGGVVLLYLGCRTIRGARPTAGQQGGPAARTGSPLLGGYLVNILNPFAAVWWAAAFGSMLSQEAGGAAGPTALLHGAAVIAGILSWHSTVALVTSWGRGLLNERVVRVISLLAGVVLILFALAFAAQGVREALCGVAGG